MTSVIKHTLRAGIGATGYRADGWNPQLTVSLHGPSPAGGELMWTVARPDGSPWFEHRVPAGEIDETQIASIAFVRRDEGGDIDEPGTVAFTLRLVSELDGVDELLHDGSLTVVAIGDNGQGEHRYAVDNDWMLGLGLLCLDAVDECDAPRLRITAFLKGDIDAYQLEAHCFHNGRRFAKASSIESRHTFTANDGTVVGRETVAVFDDVRGWNNLSASGWGDGWHLLDAHDGGYEVKLLRDATVVRVIAFEVAGGRIVAPGAVEADPWTGAVILVDAAVHGAPGEAMEKAGTPAFYGDPATETVWASIDDVYAERVAPESAPAPAFDDDTATALQAFYNRAERLILTWEADMISALAPFDYGQVLSAEGVVREKPGYEELRYAAASVPDGHAVELCGVQTTIGDLRGRMRAIFAAAEARIASAAQAEDDTLAPYRAVLRGDKLAVFDEHPADTFQYLTTDRRVIETPADLAEAQYWYFEGVLDMPGTATVDGTKITTVIRGWRVLGWQFDSDGVIIDEFERQGNGSRAPKSAFQPEG